MIKKAIKYFIVYWLVFLSSFAISAIVVEGLFSSLGINTKAMIIFLISVLLSYRIATWIRIE